MQDITHSKLRLIQSTSSLPQRMNDQEHDSTYFDCQEQIKEILTINHEKVIKYSSGAVYQGQVDRSRKVGEGRMEWPNGAYYEGKWSQDLPEGRGKFVHSNGDYYEGQWMSGKASGDGLFQDKDSEYSGFWAGDQKNGNGK